MASEFGGFSAQHGAGLAVAEGIKGGWGVAILRDEAAGFFDEAVGEHLRCASIDAGVEIGAGWVESDAEDAKAGEGIASRFPGFGERLAGGEADFDGADELGLVVGVDALGGGGIEAAKKTVQPSRTMSFGAAAETGAGFFRALRAGKEAFEQGAQIKAGAAGHDGKMAAGDDGGQSLASERGNSRRRSELVRGAGHR